MDELDLTKIPRHVAIIPDGNGRWAESRGLPRNEGHRRGTEVVREVVRAAHELGVQHLTLYAFSMENWARPSEEVNALMSLMDRYLQRECDELDENGIRVEAIGRLHMLDRRLREGIAKAQRRTESNAEMRLTFALSYSGRAELTDAMRLIARDVESGRLEPEAIDEKSIAARLYAPESAMPSSAEVTLRIFPTRIC